VFATTRGSPVGEGAVPLAVDLCALPNAQAWPRVDAIVHLAQARDYADFPSSAGAVFAVAAAATQALLDHALRTGARRFVYASTGGLYAPSSQPLRETDAVEIAPGPLAHYFASKRAGELLLAAYAGHLDVTAMRIFFCYGPGQSERMLMPRLARSILKGSPVTLQGDHGLRLNPIFVDDAAAIVAGLVERGTARVVNIAGPEVVTLEEIGHLLGRGLGVPPVFERDTAVVSPSMVADLDCLRSQVPLPETPPHVGLARLADSLVRPRFRAP
jgi:nucleoside-diphosphate-sugar epimerase